MLILNSMFGINIVKASDIINTRQYKKEIKKELKIVISKNIIRYKKLIIILNIIVKSVDVPYTLNIVSNKDLPKKNVICFRVEKVNWCLEYFAFAITINKEDSSILIINSQIIENIL